MDPQTPVIWTNPMPRGHEVYLTTAFAISLHLIGSVKGTRRSDQTKG